MKKLITILMAVLVPVLSARAQVSFGDAQKFDEGWKFMLIDNASAALPNYDDASWRSVTLPHDWSVEAIASPDLASCTGYLPGGIGWYRKHFTVTDKAARHYIYFEGVYNRSEVYLNGQYLGSRPSGFASFMYDMTPYLKEGENVIAVKADHSRYADSRWYTGSGIYRDVWIVSAPEIHLAMWGTAYRLVSMTPAKASVDVDVEVEKNVPAGAKLEAVVSLIDASGKTVATRKTQIKDQSKGVTKLTVNLSVPNPHPWNLDDPYLYQLRTDLLMGGKRIDGSEVRAGLRTLAFDADHGFALNGKNTKIKGVCLHHDAGVLGAAVPYEVWYYRLAALKEIGVNGIRGSHNPHSPMLYDICDELGLLVMDEAFDEWEFPKKKWVSGWNVGEPVFFGTDDFFNEWSERDVTDMVRRDRNHASIFLWSIGNEVDYPNDPYSHPILEGMKINQPMADGYKPDAPPAERIGMIAKRLAARVRAVDTSRPVTGALAGVEMSNETEYPDVIDVVGYNYTENRYDSDHEKYPNRIIYGSETGSGINSWFAVRDREHIFGHFLWTGTDYLGESGRFPSRGMGTGLFDLGSFPKTSAMNRAAFWSEKPFTYMVTSVYVAPPAPGQPRQRGQGGRGVAFAAPAATWLMEPGQTAQVTCYTNAPQARLRLNGNIVGQLAAPDPRQQSVSWTIPYAPGTLVAEGCDQDGNVVSSYTIRTNGLPAAIKASLVYPEVNADRGTALILVEIVDADGIPVKQADNEITCMVQGDARLLGMESGNNTDMTAHYDARERVYNGHLMAYVQTTGEATPIRVSFSSPLLKAASVEFTPVKK